MKKFNIAGVCIPEKHYMVDLTGRLAEIRRMVEDGQYFSINRGRQYGKTTLLYMLERYLKKEYQIVSISFESADDIFVDAESFAKGLLRKFREELELKGADERLVEIAGCDITDQFYWDSLGRIIRELCECSEKPVVLMVDEVDKSSDNQIFVTFLGMLRDMYQAREKYGKQTFRSVILSGVHDIRHLRLKIRPDEEHKKNSPWNIASPFDIDMSFSSDEIGKMLEEYQAEHEESFDCAVIGEAIYNYTAGYPFLVSKLCRMMDEELRSWTKESVSEAVRMLLSEELPLFESLKDRLADYPDMSSRIQGILFDGNTVPDNPDDEALSLAKMYGFVRVKNNSVEIANRIFETRLYNYFTTTLEAQNEKMYKAGAYDRNIFVREGVLDMDLVIERFALSFQDIYGSESEPFVEEVGRRYFLLYLKPIINGTGNYYIEAETRDQTRTDIIVDYLGKQYIIELKIWRGNAYNERGEKQLFDYLIYFHADKGWMVSFCFNKNKKTGLHEVHLDGKTIVEAVV